MTRLSGWKLTVILVFWGVAASAAPTRTFNTLFDFDGMNGLSPRTTLVQGTDGNFYGTTSLGGANGQGTVFRITAEGTLTTFYNFCSQPCPDGAQPMAGLVLGLDGSFYGTTSGGGTHQGGTVFNITPTGTLTTLYSFCALADCDDGSAPFAALAIGADGNLYGTTFGGGTGKCTGGCGTAFKITTSGTLTTLHSFDGAHGAGPEGPLVQGTDGNFYGTTVYGGFLPSCAGIGCGTVFKLTADGRVTTLHKFEGPDGSSPIGAIVQAPNKNLYGTTFSGGTDGYGTIFVIKGDGVLTTLYNSDLAAHSANPFGGLIRATNGLFYGTTMDNTIFKVTQEGKFWLVFNFNNRNGSEPFGLLQATDGAFYGTTLVGGKDDDGTVYSLVLGLGPFVSLISNSGKVGQTACILGQGFTGTTSVLLNGTPASFTVVSDTYIRATVPAGATTGYVTVTTPSATLTSNVPFHVIK